MEHSGCTTSAIVGYAVQTARYALVSLPGVDEQARRPGDPEAAVKRPKLKQIPRTADLGRRRGRQSASRLHRHRLALPAITLGPSAATPPSPDRCVLLAIQNVETSRMPTFRRGALTLSTFDTALAVSSCASLYRHGFAARVMVPVVSIPREPLPDRKDAGRTYADRRGRHRRFTLQRIG